MLILTGQMETAFAKQCVITGSYCWGIGDYDTARLIKEGDVEASGAEILPEEEEGIECRTPVLNE